MSAVLSVVSSIEPPADSIARTADSRWINAAGGAQALAVVLGIAISGMPLPVLPGTTGDWLQAGWAGSE